MSVKCKSDGVMGFSYTQIPSGQFGGYVQGVVTELYDSLQAAISGTLTGPGTLGTVLLCETLVCQLAQPETSHTGC